MVIAKRRVQRTKISPIEELIRVRKEFQNKWEIDFQFHPNIELGGCSKPLYTSMALFGNWAPLFIMEIDTFSGNARGVARYSSEFLRGHVYQGETILPAGLTMDACAQTGGLQLYHTDLSNQEDPSEYIERKGELGIQLMQSSILTKSPARFNEDGGACITCYTHRIPDKICRVRQNFLCVAMQDGELVALVETCGIAKFTNDRHPMKY